MKKTGIMLLIALLAITTTMPLVGCKTKVATDENTLEIYVGNFGYGTEWVEKAAEEFIKEDWVKEKYPDLKVPKPAHNSEQNFAADRILAGEVANTYDVLFTTTNANASIALSINDGSNYFENLNDVMDSEVPGEGVKLKDKMKRRIYENELIEDNAGNRAMYGVPWVDGYIGILINRTLIERDLGYEAGTFVMPRTTDELNELCEALKNAQEGKPNAEKRPVFQFSSGIRYWDQTIHNWWAQYEGLEKYHNFYQGIYGNELSYRVYEQQGRLEALEALQDLLWAPNGYLTADVNTVSFTTAQSRFMQGKGYMMPCGDFFENEMKSVAGELDEMFDIEFLQTPILSSLSDKLSCIGEGEDEKLSELIKCVDEKKTLAEAQAEIAGLTKADYDRITEARHVVGRIGGHIAYIPSYATAKEPAKDFLRYLATDKAIEIFVKSTGGCSTPYTYSGGDESEITDIGSMHRSRLRITEPGVYRKSQDAFKMVYFGGMRIFVQTAIERAYTAGNEKDRKTAQTIYQETVDYYKKDNLANWNAVLVNAGLK